MPRVENRSHLPFGPRFSFSILAPSIVLFTLAAGCASTQQGNATPDLGGARDRDPVACDHGVPKRTCTKCRPERSSSPPEEPPHKADMSPLVRAGEDLAALEPHVVAGKFTVFDFHADWCPPCRYVGAFLLQKVQSRSDVAVRKLNVVSWESPLAERWLRDVPELPFLVVFGPDGTKLAELHGAKLKTLEQLLTPKLE